MSTSRPARSHEDLRQGATSPQRVQAYFAEEVAGQEAMGLLAFHGFRTDGIVLRRADGTRWRRLRPVVHRRRNPRLAPTPILFGGVIGMLMAAVALAVARNLHLDMLTVLAVLSSALLGGLVGVAVGRTSAPPAVTSNHVSDILTPAGGCVVSVQTLRADEAQLVLERADGVLVVPAVEEERDPSEQG